MKSLVLLVLAVLMGALSGCAVDKPLTMPEMPELPSLARVPSVADLPFVYKVDIQQGNVITQEMLAQLRIGMDKKKVNFVMGSPIIMDTFHGNRWDYLYTVQTKGGRPKRRRITLFFEDDLLARIEGDVVPAAGQIAVDTRQDMTVEVPKVEKKNVVKRIAEAVPFVGEDKPKPAKKSPTVAEEEPVPGTDKPVRTEPELTPVQRAQLEEAAAPSTLGKLTDILPFVDTPEHKPLGARRPSPSAADEEEEEDPDTELEEELEEDAEIEEDSEDEESDEDGMFQSLTDVLPFMDDERDEEIAKATEEADKAEARREEERRAAEEEETAAVPVPVAVPTPRPLENQVPEEEEAPEEETADDEPGLFDRWFGRD
jgi:outer membrane protein assembly factor BamE